MSEELFSVCQYFDDDWHEYVRRYIPAHEAIQIARSYITRPAAIIGIIKRVIITDSGDCIAWEWQFGEGVVHPPPTEGAM
jgi:hypothetical protein